MLVGTSISKVHPGILARITSKRRSPWLCPAPSVGAGLFRLLPLSVVLSLTYILYCLHELPAFSLFWEHIPAYSLPSRTARYSRAGVT
jgi:hypothetical protein